MLLAILLPFLSFIVRGKIITGIICFILQITILGWIPAAIWAALSLQNSRAEKRNEKLIRAVRENKAPF
ncbi:YqaE/Pmp3 family membrane protein [Chryseobacterium scophthalmum]|uniref:YqaE/Pmp3 family membrane protein n=1 Tax=Chryseobacterium scophthalmum TaxID=59733 RepID=UPI001AEBACE8|nr:YqaE/Pmp3 family membrane protein [Chryseobacterium scophthalmum]